MKLKTILPLLLFFFSAFTFAQKYQFQSTGLSVSEKKNNAWQPWSNLQKAELFITFDTNKNRFIIYSEMIQLFDIIEYQPESETENDLVYPFLCKDNNGEICNIYIITRKKQNNRKQLYINYENLIIVYNIEYKETP